MEWRELRDWEAYFKIDPFEKNQTDRIEKMLAVLSAKLGGGTPEDYLLLSEEMREEINTQNFHREMLNAQRNQQINNDTSS